MTEGRAMQIEGIEGERIQRGLYTYLPYSSINRSHYLVFSTSLLDELRRYNKSYFPPRGLQCAEEGCTVEEPGMDGRMDGFAPPPHVDTVNAIGSWPVGGSMQELPRSSGPSSKYTSPDHEHE